MTYPLSLVNVLTVVAAAACLWAAVPEARGNPHGVVRPQPALDGAVFVVGVVAAALIDAVAGFLPQGTLPRQAHIAAASSLFAGYLAGRA